MMRYIVGRRAEGSHSELGGTSAKLDAAPGEAAPLAEPVRLLASDAALSSTMRGLLLSPPPVKPLDAQVAMRVRGAVLQSPHGGLAAAKAAGATPSQPAALAKLGVLAGGAALFGAGVMTLVSGYLASPGQYSSVTNRHNVVISSSNGGSSADAVRSTADDVVSLSPTALGVRDGRATTNETALGHDGIAGLDSTTQRGTSVGEGSAARDSRSDAHERWLTDKVVSVDDLASVDDALFQSSPQDAHDDTRVVVRPAFRRIASTVRNGKPSPRTLSSLEEETSLLEEARSKLGREPERALTLALQHQSRFRNGQLLEQRRMIHLEALLRLGRDSEALELAKTIDGSLYRTRARALLTKYGI